MKSIKITAVLALLFMFTGAAHADFVTYVDGFLLGSTVKILSPTEAEERFDCPSATQMKSTIITSEGGYLTPAKGRVADAPEWVARVDRQQTIKEAQQVISSTTSLHKVIDFTTLLAKTRVCGYHTTDGHKVTAVKT